MAGKMADREALKMEEESLFLKVLGGKDPTLKILDFLIDNIGFDYSKTDIAAGAGISRTTLFSVWENLEANELVAFTREVGRAKMYRLNMENEVVKKLIELDRAIANCHSSRLAAAEVAIDDAPEISRDVEDVPEKRAGIPICLL